VALLFLTPDGELPHEAAWRAWLRGAEGLLPVAQFVAGTLPPQLGLCAKARPAALPPSSPTFVRRGLVVLPGRLQPQRSA